jgi:hypothetical protein
MTLVTEPILGLENIQRAAFLVFFEQLNGAISQIASFMDDRDQEFATRTGRDYVPTVVEPVDSNNFYEGHRPSLIDAPVTLYPNFSVWSVRATPTPESADFDQSFVSRTLLYIECMVKSNLDEGEVNRRLLRTVEATHLCVMSNPTLGGVVIGADSDPSVTISEVFTRKERTAYGPHWFWQGARLEYAVRKESAMPSFSTSGSIFRTAPSGPGIAGTDFSQFIDQS